MRTSACLALLALLFTACATTSDQQELQMFLNQREICDHLRGEIPDGDDKERQSEVLAGIQQHCRGTDDRLRRLKKRFAHDPQVMTTLNALEERIEVGPSVGR